MLVSEYISPKREAFLRKRNSSQQYNVLEFQQETDGTLKLSEEC